jgi:hypothetical protein
LGYNHALPDLFAITILIGTPIALLAWRIGVIKLMIGGAGLEESGNRGGRARLINDLAGGASWFL